MKKEIQKLMDSNISSYKIGKETGVSNSIIQRLRNGDRAVGNLTLDTAEKIYGYAKTHHK
jgi:transcriptional regulator with XRE-family HTH domain